MNDTDHNEPPRQVALQARDRAETDLSQVRDSLRGLRFGVVEIIVQDGVIVQINRTEKRRLQYTTTQR